MVTGKGRNPRGRINPSSYVFAALMLVSFAALFFSTRSFIADFKNMGLSLFSGVRGSVNEVSSLVSRTALSVRELASLREEYAELSARVTRYEQLERSAAEIGQENMRLREQLGFSRTLRYRHIPAELIGRDPDNLFSAFVINRGKKDGVAYNMPVIAFQNGTQALAGKVVQAGRSESLVMPLYDLSSSVPARLSVSRFEGLAEGQGAPGVPLLMRLINKRAREEISYGDMVVSSGTGRVYPSGINIGRVSRIIYHEDDISMEAELEPVVDFSRLEYVFVIEALESSREENSRGEDGAPDAGEGAGD
ncbi:MAG: rod shape-determining protein MreC [Treponema sp.]|jgi:rod shape-determining protein MreC|nr:rod shape-determining protein MreC [Treponema sp.]